MEHIERREQRHGFFWPVVLIGLGILFLLGNLGSLSWGALDAVFRLWPILLVGGGLEILIGRRSPAASLAVAIGTVVLMIAGAWLLSTGSIGSYGFTSETINQPLGTAKRANVVIGMDVGTLRIGAAQTGSGLVQGSVDVRQGERLTRDFNVVGDTASFTLRANEQRRSWIWPGPRSDAQRVWDLKLNRAVPTELTINTGVGSSTIDLADVGVTTLQVTTGVGQTELTLPRAGHYTANVTGGVGETIITIPKGVAAQIVVESHLGGLNIPDTYTKRDGTYTAPGYDTAANQVKLVIHSGVGSITVR